MLAMDKARHVFYLFPIFRQTSIPEKLAAPPELVIVIEPSLTVVIHGPSRCHTPSTPL
jgi:hypothetical protein